MQQQTQRLIGVVAAIASAMVFIYGAFYFAGHNPSLSLNVPLWLGVLGMLGGGAMLVLGSRNAVPPL